MLSRGDIDGGDQKAIAVFQKKLRMLCAGNISFSDGGLKLEKLKEKLKAEEGKA